MDDSDPSSPDPLALSGQYVQSSPLKTKSSGNAVPARRSEARSETAKVQQKELILNTPVKARRGSAGERQQSPWRIRVTVEAEPQDEIEDEVEGGTRTTRVPLREAGEGRTVSKRRTGRGQQGRGTPPRKRKLNAGTGEDEWVMSDGAPVKESIEASMPITDKRGRGRPKKRLAVSDAADMQNPGQDTDQHHGNTIAGGIVPESKSVPEKKNTRRKTSLVHAAKDADGEDQGKGVTEPKALNVKRGLPRKSLALNDRASEQAETRAYSLTTEGDSKPRHDISTKHRRSRSPSAARPSDDGAHRLASEEQIASGPTYNAPSHQSADLPNAAVINSSKIARRQPFNISALTPLHKKQMPPLPRRPQSPSLLKSVRDRVPTPRKPLGYREDLESPLPVSSPVKEAVAEAMSVKERKATPRLALALLDKDLRNLRTISSPRITADPEIEKTAMEGSEDSAGDADMWQGMIGEPEGFEHEELEQDDSESEDEEAEGSDDGAGMEQDKELNTQFMPGERTVKENEDFSMVSMDSLPSMLVQASFISQVTNLADVDCSRLSNGVAGASQDSHSVLLSPFLKSAERSRGYMAHPEISSSGPHNRLTARVSIDSLSQLATSSAGVMLAVPPSSPELPPLLARDSVVKEKVTVPQRKTDTTLGSTLQKIVSSGVSKPVSGARLESPFQGFGHDTRRELNAGLKLGTKLAAQQDSDFGKATSHVNESFTFTRSPGSSAVKGQTKNNSHSTVTYPRLLTPSDSDKEQNLPSIEHPTLTAKMAETQLHSPVQDADEMSWRITTPQRTALPKAPYSTTVDRERRWQAEREQVSRQIEEANTSQVIVIGDDSEVAAEEPQAAGEEATSTDIWQLEAEANHDSSMLRPNKRKAYEMQENTPQLKDLFEDDGPAKPRRSKIPSPWRRASDGMSLLYSDEIEGSGAERHVKHDKAAIKSELNSSTSAAEDEVMVEPGSKGELDDAEAEEEEDADDTGMFWHENMPTVFEKKLPLTTNVLQNKIDLSELLGLKNGAPQSSPLRGPKNAQWSSPVKSEPIVSEELEDDESEDGDYEDESSESEDEDDEDASFDSEDEEEEDSFDSTTSDVRQLQEEMTLQLHEAKHGSAQVRNQAPRPQSQKSSPYVSSTGSRLQQSSPYTSPCRPSPSGVRYYDPLRPKKVYPPLFGSPSWQSNRSRSPSRASVAPPSYQQRRSATVAVSQSTISRVTKASTTVTHTAPKTMQLIAQPPASLSKPSVSAQNQEKQKGLFSRLVSSIWPSSTPTRRQLPYPCPTIVDKILSSDQYQFLPLPTSPPLTQAHWDVLRLIHKHIKSLPAEWEDHPTSPAGKKLLEQWEDCGLGELKALLGKKQRCKGYELVWEMWMCRVVGEMLSFLTHQHEILGADTGVRAQVHMREKIGFGVKLMALAVFAVFVGQWMREDEKAGRRAVYGTDERDKVSDEVIIRDWRAWVCEW